MTTHIEEFAKDLRGLKERSGRSYGLLASRLHVSTSTLHRYCNGAAVPGDYAPVERFARQCGADAGELLALHRRWLLADAERRGGQDRSPQPPAPPEPDAEPAPPAPDTGPAGGPAAPVPASAITGGARTGVREAGDGASAADDGVPAADEGVPAANDGVPAADDGVPGPHRPRRTRAVLAAVAGAAVLAVALPMALRPGHGPDPARSLPAASGRTAGATARPEPSGASPSGPAVPRSPSPAGTPSRTAPAAGRAAPGRTADGGAPPVQVTVLSDNWDTQCGEWFLLRQGTAEVPPPPALQQTNAWAAALGGTPARDLRLQLTAQGRPGEPVVLHALYVKVVSSAAAPKGNGYTPGSGCGGGLEPASFGIDLDTTVPGVHPAPGLAGVREAPTAGFPYEVSATDPQVLDIDAHTTDHDVSWYLDLLWTCGTRQGTLRIDDHGSPFRTVGLKGDPLYFYDGTSWTPTP